MTYSKEVTKITRKMVDDIMSKLRYCPFCKRKDLTILDFSEISSFFGMCMKCFIDKKMKKKIKFKLK